MALQPSLRDQLIIGDQNAPHTLEVWIDYVCPFCAKLFARGFPNGLLPLIKEGGKYHGKVKLLLRLQVQPWHASSTFLHEAALAVGRVKPEAFYDYSVELFANQKQFFDKPSADLSVKEIRKRLVELARPVFEQYNFHGDELKAKLDEVTDHLTNKTTDNGGVDVTDDLKYNIKVGRQNGIHVTPTAVWDGLIIPDFQSSWGDAEFKEFFQAKVQV